MVTVDMSTTRSQITKRQRRMRRAAQRRIQRQHKAQLHEIRVAEAARQARQRAIAAWNAEEDRLQRLRDTQQDTNNQQNHNASTPQEKPRAVKFAEQVLVTEIPVHRTDKLPKPVSSPIGVSICGTDDESEYDNDSNDRASNNSVTFSQLPDGAFADDDDDDPEFAPDESLLSVVPSRPIQRPRRRIVAKRLDVPLEQIIPSKHTKKVKTAHSPKRPRPETRQSSTPTSSSAPSLSQSRDQNIPEAAAKGTSREAPAEEQRRPKQRGSCNEESLKTRLKPKRKRVHNVDNRGQGENEQRSARLMSEADNKTVSSAAQRQEHAKDQQENSVKGKHMRPSFENRASNCSSENSLLTSSSAKVVELKSASVQRDQAKSVPKNRDKSSTLANGHAMQNGCKLNGFHDALVSKNQDKPHDGDNDKDLDNIFGDLIKQKAANRASKEKMALQKKRKLEDNESELAGAKAKKKKFKKGPARYTEDGLRVMTYEEIAADQPPGLNGDCPFDCSCCF